MFWSVAYAGASSIDNLLKSSDGFTIEQLLDADELLQECKSQNATLIAFLAEPESMRKLVEYVIEMPSETDSEERRYKYPFVASEVLSCDVDALRAELLSPPRRLVPQLLSLLDAPPPLPPVLVGYVGKVLISLFKYAPDKFLLYFTELWAADPDSPYSLSKLLPLLLRHLGSDAVLQMLTVLCGGEPNGGDGPPHQQSSSSTSWIPHAQLVPALLDNLSCADPESVQNSAQLLGSLLDGTVGMLPCLCEPKDEARQRCRQLVANCLGGTLTAGGALNLSALDVLLRTLPRACDAATQGTTTPLEAMLVAIAEAADAFFMALATPAPLPPRIARFLPTSDLETMPRPQAAQRTKLLSLFEEALRVKHSCDAHRSILEALRQLGFYQVVLDLLLLPHTCNAIHIRAASIVEETLKMEGSHDALLMRQALLQDAQLARRLVDFCEAESNARIRPTCYAFVMSLCTALKECAARDATVAAALETVDCWSATASADGALGHWEAVHSKPLGGRLPTRSSDIDDDSDGDGDLGSNVRDVQRTLTAQSAFRSDASRDDDEDDEDDEPGHSSEYLEQFAQTLSQLNFLNDMNHGLDAAANDDGTHIPEEWSSDANWSAEFDADGEWPDGEADGPSGELPPIVSAPATAAALLDFDDFDDAAQNGNGGESGGAEEGKDTDGSNGLLASNGGWDAEFEQVPPAPAPAPAPAADESWAAAFLPPDAAEAKSVEAPKRTEFEMYV